MFFYVILFASLVSTALAACNKCDVDVKHVKPCDGSKDNGLIIDYKGLTMDGCKATPDVCVEWKKSVKEAAVNIVCEKNGVRLPEVNFELCEHIKKADDDQKAMMKLWGLDYDKCPIGAEKVCNSKRSFDITPYSEKMKMGKGDLICTIKIDQLTKKGKKIQSCINTHSTIKCQGIF